MTLAQKSCIPCMGGIPPLTVPEQTELIAQLDATWRVVDGHHLERIWIFPDFKTAFAFTTAIADLAEAEGHHPDIHLAWGKVRIELWTHKIDGLTESDFILAAKLDDLPLLIPS